VEHEVSTLGSLLVEIGFFGWIGSTFALIFRGFTKENDLITRKAFFWGVLIVVFYAVWIIGLKVA